MEGGHVKVKRNVEVAVHAALNKFATECHYFL